MGVIGQTLQVSRSIGNELRTDPADTAIMATCAFLLGLVTVYWSWLGV